MYAVGVSELFRNGNTRVYSRNINTCMYVHGHTRVCQIEYE